MHYVSVKSLSVDWFSLIGKHLSRVPFPQADTQTIILIADPKSVSVESRYRFSVLRRQSRRTRSQRSSPYFSAKHAAIAARMTTAMTPTILGVVLHPIGFVTASRTAIAARIARRKRSMKILICAGPHPVSREIAAPNYAYFAIIPFDRADACTKGGFWVPVACCPEWTHPLALSAVESPSRVQEPLELLRTWL